MNDRDLVHLACGEVAALLREAPAGASWLHESEARRLATITTEPRRQQFLAARWQARWLLAQVLGGPSQQWMLEAPADAPPRVPGRADLFLSISHSGDRSACALASVPIGLDLEQPRRQRDIGGLVALVCTPHEQAMFAGLSDRDREALFYELWTVKEAWLKRKGEWIAPSRLAQIEASRSPDGELRTWRTGTGHLTVSAHKVWWWTPEPEPWTAWTVVDRA